MCKCPCKQCITYAICHKHPSVKELIDKCSILNDYIIDRKTSLKAIEIISPDWHVKGVYPGLQAMVIIIRNHSIRIQMERSN